MDKGGKKWKNPSIVIVNSKTKMTRPITLEVPVQEQKLKLKRVMSDISDGNVCPLCNRPVKTGVGYAVDGSLQM